MWICVLSLLQGILLFWFLSSRFIRLHFSPDPLQDWDDWCNNSGNSNDDNSE